MRSTTTGFPTHLATRSLALASLALCALSTSTLRADVPSVIAFQGYLSDDVGIPIDGTVAIDVSLYDVETNGTALWSESHPSVLVAGGVFSLELGEVVALPDSVFDEDELWLGIAVDAEAELPRTPLRTTPFAFRAQTSDRLEGLEADAFVRADGDTIPGALRLEGGVEALAPGGGITEVVASTSDVLLRRWALSPAGGSWAGVSARVILVVNGGLTGGAGTATVSLDDVEVAAVPLDAGLDRPSTYAITFDVADGSVIDVGVRAAAPGAPVLVRALRLETVASMEMEIPVTLDDAYDGGAAGAGRTITVDAGPLELLGPDGLSVSGPIVSTATAGDSSVVLPDSSLSRDEILDEGGIAVTRRAGNQVVTDSVVEMIDVAVVTITTPTEGYIHLEASAQARFSASTTGNVMAVQIDEGSGGVIDVTHYHFSGWESDSPAGESYRDVALARTYFKPAGTYTFRLEAMDHDDQGAKSLWNSTLSATFHSTAYGVVESFTEPGAGDETIHVEGNGGPSADVDAIDLRSLESSGE